MTETESPGLSVITENYLSAQHFGSDSGLMTVAVPLAHLHA